MRHTTLIPLALAALGLPATIPSAEATPPEMPDAPLIVRDHCFGGAAEGTLQGIQGGAMLKQSGGSAGMSAGAIVGAGGGGVGVGGLGTSGSGSGASGYGRGFGSVSGTTTRSRKAKTAGNSPQAEAQAAPVGRPAPPPAPKEDADIAEAESMGDGLLGRHQRDLEDRKGPVIDWGGSTWLSNDDSMSLASAQRLLWALEEEARFTLSQIRPHELLNYFTFDTTRPTGRDTFQVNASAEIVDHDTMTLALAVQGATPPRASLDLTVLVDRSGSMSAEGRMEYTKRALHLASDQLAQGDRIDLVLFDDRVCTPVENFTVGRDDPAILKRAIDLMQPRSSTNLDLGLKEAYRVAVGHAPEAERAQRVMVFTDAILNTGDVDPHTVTEIGKALDRHDIRLTGVGVGRDFRDDVLDRLTEKGKGAYVFLGTERVVDRLFDRGFDALVQTIAHDVHFRLDLPDSLGLETFYGEEASTRKEDVQEVHFHAGNSQVFLQDLAMRNGRGLSRDELELFMTWTDPATGEPREQTFRTTVGDALRADTHNVRKGRALMAWTDILTAHAMGGDACGAPLTDYRRALPGLEQDAEIAYVSELVGRWCDLDAPVARWTEPAYLKVRLDSDVDLTGAEVRCGGSIQGQRITAGTSVARFDARPGACHLTLYGAVPMTTTIDVPAQGMDMRCTVRGGRMACR